MKKKFSSMLLVTALAMTTILAGCGSNTNAGSNANTNEPAQEGNTNQATGSQTETAKEPVTIKYYNWDNEAQAESTKKYIAGFETKYPNVKVESVTLVPGNSLESLKKLDVLAASGEQIDVVVLSNLSELNKRAAQGVLAPLDEYFQKEGLNPADEYYTDAKFSGKTYGIQNNITTNFILLNKDALDEVRLPVPKADWTWDDFRDYAKKLNKGEGTTKRYGTYFHSWSIYMNPAAQVHMLHPFLNEDGTTNFGDPSYLNFFNLRRAMEQEDKSAKPYADVIGAKLAYRAEFFNEQAAMMLTGSWMINEVGDITKFPHTFKTAFAPVPVEKAGDSKDIYMGGNFLSVGASSKHKEEAFQFARYMSTDLSDARTELPGWKKGDAKPLVERLISQNKELYDVDSLMYTLFDAGINALPPSKNDIAYGADLEKVLIDGFSKFILDNQPAEDVQKWMVDEANKIIEKNKGK